MIIYLYKTESENNALNKVLSAETELSGALRDASSVIRPNIVISADNISDYNYAYIPSFGRYYYIDDITSIRNGVWGISLSVDVLMSYNSEISDIYGIVSDTEVTGESNYIAGPQWVTSVKESTSFATFPHGLLNSGEYILITAGG